MMTGFPPGHFKFVIGQVGYHHHPGMHRCGVLTTQPYNHHGLSYAGSKAVPRFYNLLVPCATSWLGAAWSGLPGDETSGYPTLDNPLACATEHRNDWRLFGVLSSLDDIYEFMTSELI